jgi:hypothetical protein
MRRPAGAVKAADPARLITGELLLLIDRNIYTRSDINDQGDFR